MTGDFKHIPELCKEQDFTEDTLKNESYELFLRGRTVQRYSSELDTRRRSGRSGVLHLSPLYTSVLCLRTGENFITRMPIVSLSSQLYKLLPFSTKSFPEKIILHIM